MPTAQRIAARVRAAHDQHNCFDPAVTLPVRINPRDRTNPYSLSRVVRYDDGIVRVKMPEGFSWDGASIPYSWPVLLWLLSLIAHHMSSGPLVWLASVAVMLYTLRLLPYLQRIGPHARAACVHDWLYRSRKVSRAIADAILLAIMELDQVPVDIRLLIYLNVRLFGWSAYRSHSQVAQAVAAQNVEVTL